MNISVKWIYDEKGKPESVVLSKKNYEKLLRYKEDLEDIRALKDYEASGEEGFPSEVVERLDHADRGGHDVAAEQERGPDDGQGGVDLPCGGIDAPAVGKLRQTMV